MCVGWASRGDGVEVRQSYTREEPNSYPGLGRAIVIFQFNPKFPLRRCTGKRGDNIKSDIREIKYQGVD
jgi:hypothetical protein